MDGSGMTGAVEQDHSLGLVDAVLDILCLQHGQNRRKLFSCQRFVRSDFLAFGNQNGSVGIDFKAGLLGDPVCALAGNAAVQTCFFASLAVGFGIEHEAFELFLFFLCHIVDIVVTEFILDIVIDFLVNDDSLFGSTDHAVVECLGKGDIGDSLGDIGRCFDIGRNIAGTDTEGRLAAAVGSLDHGIAAGRKDRGNAGMVHQGTGRFHARCFDPLNAVFRCTGRNRRVIHDLGGSCRTVLGIGVEGEDDRISCLQTDQRLEDGRGCRIGDRSDAGNDTDRLRDIFQTFDGIFFNDADRLLIAHVIDDIFTGKQILGCLVLKDTALGLFNGQLCQFAVPVQGGDRTFGDNVVDLFLIVGCILIQGFQCLCDFFVHFGNRCGTRNRFRFCWCFDGFSAFSHTFSSW